MIKYIKGRYRLYQTKFSFGATSAIITNLGLITGLDSLSHPKLSIIGGILVIALADNISDSVGIHIYQESECIPDKEVWFSTFSNFFTRILVSLTFIILVLVLPIRLAVFCSIIWGLLLLAFMSYTIAKDRAVKPYKAIFEHISIAIFVIIVSGLVGRSVLRPSSAQSVRLISIKGLRSALIKTNSAVNYYLCAESSAMWDQSQLSTCCLVGCADSNIADMTALALASLTLVKGF